MPWCGSPPTARSSTPNWSTHWSAAWRAVRGSTTCPRCSCAPCPTAWTSSWSPPTALRRVGQVATGHHRVHVTSGVYTAPDDFSVMGLCFAPDASDLRVTLDTPDDLRMLRAVVADARHVAAVSGRAGRPAAGRDPTSWRSTPRCGRRRWPRADAGPAALRRRARRSGWGTWSGRWPSRRWRSAAGTRSTCSGRVEGALLESLIAGTTGLTVAGHARPGERRWPRWPVATTSSTSTTTSSAPRCWPTSRRRPADDRPLLSSMVDGRFGARPADVLVDPTVGAEREHPPAAARWHLRGSRFTPVREATVRAWVVAAAPVTARSRCSS